MIVVVIIAILVAITYPSYTKQVQKTRRHKAEACLMELAQYMERFYTTNLKYHQDSSGNAVTLPGTDCRNELSGFYTFGFSGTPTATTFTIQAVPAGAQAGDACGTLTINQTGRKTPANTPGCWGN